MDEKLEQAQGLLAAGDVLGLIRHLRTAGETLPLGEIARLLAGAARLARFDDLARAAAVAGGVRAASALRTRRRCTTSATPAPSAGSRDWPSGR